MFGSASLSTTMVVSMLRCMTAPTRRHAQARPVPAPREDLCLEFANTRYRRRVAEPTETMSGLADLLAWCETAKSLDRAMVAALGAWAQRHKGDAAHLFEDAIAARETIYRLFSATASAEAVSNADIEALNRLLEKAPGRTNAAIAEAGNAWRLPPAAPAAASLLAPVLWSAGDLLVGDRAGRVRLCANEKCGWLFLDDSKSGTRRWCSMSSCGNRAKAHRHFLRHARPAVEADC
jgi:predicted RNA-binding Zn ribbon-like protein